jgi:hypothetical protein
MQTERVREQLLDIARQYERLAATVEKLSDRRSD